MRRGLRGGVCPTLNAFDNATETRATVVAFGITDDETAAEDLMPTMQTPSSGGGGHPPAVVIVAFSHTQGLDAQPSVNAWPTLRSNGGGQAVSESAVRRLTPRECEALQGFPRDWTAGQSDSQRYKQMGNAVTVNVAHYVAALIEANTSVEVSHVR
jgi:site-specific DNA-cytosine methylase